MGDFLRSWMSGFLVRFIENNGERNRGLYVLKARGTAHSNQVREFVMNERGIDLLDVYVGRAGVLTGAARLAQEVSERADAAQRRQAMALRKQREPRAPPRARRGADRRDARGASTRTRRDVVQAVRAGRSSKRQT